MSEAIVQLQAPEFRAQAVMPDGSFKEYPLRIQGEARCPVFYPLDFTFVCPTEIIALSDRLKEFEARNTQVIGVSVDSHFHILPGGTPRVRKAA